MLAGIFVPLINLSFLSVSSHLKFYDSASFEYVNLRAVNEAVYRVWGLQNVKRRVRELSLQEVFVVSHRGHLSSSIKRGLIELMRKQAAH